MNKRVLEKISVVFSKFGIPYALIGGYAAAVWGSVRATKDIDFLANISFNIVNNVIDEFKNQGFSIEYRLGDFDDPIPALIKLEFRIEEHKESVEILLGIREMPIKIFSRAERVDILGFKIPVVSPEDFIVLKLLAGSPLDISDAKNIFYVMKDKLDISYLESELDRCGLSFEKITEK